jgi:hypothetical protein
MSIVDGICPEATTQYNCSFHTSNTNLDLTWRITYLGEPPTVISYRAPFTINAVQVRDDITATLTAYRVSTYIESVISLELFTTVVAPEIQCTIGDLPTVTGGRIALYKSKQ